MNFRTTYILLGIVVVALGVLGIIVIRSGDKKTKPSVEGYLVKTLRAAGVEPDKVTEVTIERPGQTPDKIAFVRESGKWVMLAPDKARADNMAIDSMIASLLNAKTEKSADISSNLAVHGLDNPPVKVTLKAGSLSETVSLGNVTVGGDQAVVYVATSDRPDTAQAVLRRSFALFFKREDPKAPLATHAGQLVKGLSDFRPLKVIGDGIVGPVDQVVRDVVVRNNKDSLALFRLGATWKFRKPDDYGDAAGDAADQFGGPKGVAGEIKSVSQLLNTIMNIQPASAKQIVEAPGDLKKYGLDPTNDPLQIDLVRDDGVKETVLIGGPIKAEDASEKYFAKHEVDTVVYEVPAEPVKKVVGVLANKSALRDRTVLKLNASRVDAIDIDAAGEKVELRRSSLGAWQVYDAEGKGRPAKSAAVNELLGRLSTPQLAASFPPPGVPDDKMGFTKPKVEMKIWEAGIPPDPKADPNVKPAITAPPTVPLLFGITEVGNVVLLRRLAGETKADFHVPADLLPVVQRGRLDYLDATLKPYQPNQILKLVFTHGKETFNLERPDDGKPLAQATWTISSPERLKGRPADPLKVAELINQLTFLSALRAASDKVTDDVLNRLEVNPASPRLKLSFTVKGEGEKTYLFGGDVGTEKKNVYLKPADQDLVVEVDRHTFDLFTKADVQDTIVHRIDKTKIKALKITGWQEVLGAPTTLEIERKDGKWTLKSGAMFELDAMKVDAFLDDLTTPRADAFVVYKEGPKPEHNLDVAKNALAIELVLEAGDPVKITISPPSKEGKVFATTSLLPGDVFTMADRFAVIRAKLAALKKD